MPTLPCPQGSSMSPSNKIQVCLLELERMLLVIFLADVSTTAESTTAKSGAKRKTISSEPAVQKQKKTCIVPVTIPPLSASYNGKIRPLLKVIDRLRNLMIINEGIQLPTIVVVGDQSSGKSSVLESLAGISLPRGHGLCTRVPLIIRLQHHENPEPELYLEFNGKIIHTSEETVSDAISVATEEIVGNKKGISNTPLTLVVRKDGMPDLTMVDLPGITRVPVQMIMEYIKPEENIILNVVSATVNFRTCESIRMSQIVDKSRQRTLVVVTQADWAPDGHLLEKVTADDDVNIRLGYVWVRNRIGDETYEEARMKEERLFEEHHVLSKIDKSIVGIPVLCEKLMQIQATIVARRCLPRIVREIKEKLNHNISELNKMPKLIMTSANEAMREFTQIMGYVKCSLCKLMVSGEYDEYPKDEQMHCGVRFEGMMKHYRDDLLKSEDDDNNQIKSNFLKEELAVLGDQYDYSKVINMPHLPPPAPELFHRRAADALHTIVRKKVNEMYLKPQKFVTKLWNYIEVVFTRVLMEKYAKYPQLHTCLRRCAQIFMAKMKEKALNRMVEVVEMEKIAAAYTSSFPNYDNVSEMNNLFKKLLDAIENVEKPRTVCLGGSIGVVEVDNLRKYSRLQLKEAFYMRMRITSYWRRVVVKRLVESMSLHVKYDVHMLLNKEVLIMNQLVGPHFQQIAAARREKLENINLLNVFLKFLSVWPDYKHHATSSPVYAASS